MAYNNHQFCWHGILTTDIEAAKRFYAQAIGHEIMEMPMGDGVAVMVAAGGIPRAHMMAPPMAGVPSYWESYLRVEDVAVSLAAAVAAGGREIMAPTDIPPGRFCVVASPSGAVLSLFRESDEQQSQNPPDTGEGYVHWVELHSHSLEADLAWLKQVFGYETSTMEMPGGASYYVLQDGDAMVGGAMAAMDKDMPSNWLVWLGVSDVDACVARIQEHGGKALSPVMVMEGVGRMYVVADSTGGVFGVIQPQAR